MSIEPLQVPSSPTPSAPAGTDPVIEGPRDETRTPRETSRASTPSRRDRRRDTRLRARKVTRVLRRIDPWSVLKVSAVLYLCLWLVITVAGAILWQVARVTGTLDNLQDFLATALADDTFTIEGGRVLLSTLLGGAVLVFAGTGLTVLLAVLFNLVSELTGGLQMSVVELETATVVDEDS
jgi:hypothetical protein